MGRCDDTLVRICENIVLFQPLPYQCTPDFNNNYCLTLSNPDNIRCNSEAPPPSVGGGSYPVLGGYGSSEPIGPEQNKIADTATKKILTTVSGVTECGDLTLLEITHFSRQIVAGTNFKLSLKLRSRCDDTLVRICENIVLFRPLPHQCTPDFNNNYCLTLSNPENILCNSPPSVRGGSYPVLGGYGSSEPILAEQKKIAATVTKKMLTTVSGVTECGDLTLLEITHFSRQIVAGTNFKLSLKLRSRCDENLVRICENIVLYQPLPHQCTPAFNNNYCLTLSNPEDILCN